MSHEGLHTYRFKQNPEEGRIAKAWAKFAEGSLRYLLAPSMSQGGCRTPPSISERDEVVAATTMQWLCSPIGQCFLRDLGYVREEGK